MRINALVLVFAVASVPVRAHDLDTMVMAYYESVLRDEIPGTRALLSSLPPGTMTPSIGWTASGRPFVNVVAGEIECETRVVAAPERFHELRRQSRLKPLGDRVFACRVCIIRSADLPEYHDYIGHPRSGFSSIDEDLVFLDARHAGDSLVLEEAFEHEIMHILDRDLYDIIAPEDLEIRGMIRGLSRGQIPLRNVARLIFALQEGEPKYRSAASRILAALGLVLGTTDPFELEKAAAVQLQTAARALEIILGI